MCKYKYIYTHIYIYIYIYIETIARTFRFLYTRALGLGQGTPTTSWNLRGCSKTTPRRACAARCRRCGWRAAPPRPRRSTDVCVLALDQNWSSIWFFPINNIIRVSLCPRKTSCKGLSRMCVGTTESFLSNSASMQGRLGHAARMGTSHTHTQWPQPPCQGTFHSKFSVLIQVQVLTSIETWSLM